MKLITLFKFMFAFGLMQACGGKPEWIAYSNTKGDFVTTIAEEGDIIWYGTKKGLVKFERTEGKRTQLTESNSGLSDNDVKAITMDKKHVKWISTSLGLSTFDGTNWDSFDISNSRIPANLVSAVAIDASDTKWIGTNKGLAKFDGTNWTVFTTSNSPLPNDRVTAVTVGKNDNIWIGTEGDGI